MKEEIVLGLIILAGGVGFFALLLGVSWLWGTA
jgi:hypothetical protein